MKNSGKRREQKKSKHPNSSKYRNYIPANHEKNYRRKIQVSNLQPKTKEINFTKKPLEFNLVMTI